jgi:hypothetical protein
MNQEKRANKKGLELSHSLLFNKIPWIGFEPMTYRLEGGCSIQLSYQGITLSFCLII